MSKENELKIETIKKSFPFQVMKVFATIIWGLPLLLIGGYKCIELVLAFLFISLGCLTVYSLIIKELDISIGNIIFYVMMFLLCSAPSYLLLLMFNTEFITSEIMSNLTNIEVFYVYSLVSINLFIYGIISFVYMYHINKEFPFNWGDNND